ncbi:hypothetical protein [Streptomyces chartreusis]
MEREKDTAAGTDGDRRHPGPATAPVIEHELAETRAVALDLAALDSVRAF